MYQLKISREQLDIDQILDSGQVFRFERLEDESFVLICMDQFVRVVASTEGYLFDCSEDEFLNVWFEYLDLGRDYTIIKKKIIQTDTRLEAIIKSLSGLRLLNQDGFEMLMTFIISQSKSMVQIRRLVNELSEKFGRRIGEVNGKAIHRFPLPQELSHLKEEDFRKMKFGYRSPYLKAAVDFSLIDQEMKKMDNEQLKITLESIHGVGSKVAACVMLFGYDRVDAFPVDTWIRKIMLHLYENEIRKRFKVEKGKKVTNRQIENYGKEVFGDTAGIAQQYLFEYGRELLN